MSLVAVRRRVPNDHSCLFWAIAYVAEGKDATKSKARELRDVCAEDALKDSDPLTRALLLGFNSVDEYATWIRNEFHWGGENEVNVLAKHYGVEVAVVNCESLRVLCYGSDHPGCSHRVYILYTGQHYDAIVGGSSVDVSTADQTHRFPKGDVTLEASCLELARAHNVEAARKASERRAKRIKCLGCGTLCTDNEDFAKHCGEVEHGDDFAYECEEVEIVIEGGEALPEGTLDLASDSVHTFYNTTEKEPFASVYPSPFDLGGNTYPTFEHYWQCAPFLGRDAELCARIRAAASPREANMIAQGASAEAQRPDWRESRESLLIEALRAKFKAHPALVDVLLATGEKTLVCIDTDPWAGMQSPGGIPTGQNNVGKALMTVRQELRK